MITNEQQVWLDTLSDDNSVEIFPFNPKSFSAFKKLEKILKKALKNSFEILHRGATSLGISGQGELDVYIPVPVEKMKSTARIVEKIFGKARNIYPNERIRFVTFVDDVKAEIFVVNEGHKSWKDNCLFYQYLLNNSESLRAYKSLKEDGRGLSTKAYYTKKIEFINEILEKALKD